MSSDRATFAALDSTNTLGVTAERPGKTAQWLAAAGRPRLTAAPAGVLTGSAIAVADRPARLRRHSAFVKLLTAETGSSASAFYRTAATPHCPTATAYPKSAPRRPAITTNRIELADAEGVTGRLLGRHPPSRTHRDG